MPAHVHRCTCVLSHGLPCLPWQRLLHSLHVTQNQGSHAHKRLLHWLANASQVGDALGGLVAGGALDLAATAEHVRTARSDVEISDGFEEVLQPVLTWLPRHAAWL